MKQPYRAVQRYSPKIEYYTDLTGLKPDFRSDVPPFVRYHAPAIRAHLKTWSEDIEADDFLRGEVVKDGTEYMAFQCVKFPKSEAMIPSIEFEPARQFERMDLFDAHTDLLVWRGWSDLFTNIHADIVRTEVISEIKLRAREVWKELFPESKPLPLAIPDRDKIPTGLGFEFRDDWCHHCEMTTVHSNSEHDPYTFHCTERHVTRPRFEN